MKKRRIFKRGILSILLSLSMVVSPLASTGLVVSAAESGTKTFYTQDFSKVTDATSVASSQNAATALSIAKDNSHGNYLNYDLTALKPSGGRGAVLNFTDADITNCDTYVVEFDAAVRPGNNKETGFGVSGKDIKYVSNNVNYGAESGYIFYLVNAGANSTVYTVKGTNKTINIPSGEWCHYKLSVDNTKGTVTVDIIGTTTGYIAKKMEVAYNGAGKASALYMVPGRYNGAMSIDNVTVRTLEEADLKDNYITPVSTAYYVIAAATGDTTTVNTSALSKSNKITGYQITTARGGALVKQEVVKTVPASVNTKGADWVEIAPVFYYDIGVAGEKGQAGYNIPVIAGSYDFVVYNTSGQRCDVYADDQMLVNNILQYGSTPNYFAVKDIVLSDDTATISTADYVSGKTANNMNIKVQIVKSATIVDRTQKVYVLGDSLVAVYYNNGSLQNNVQTGWGQVLENYLVDRVDVVDLANSGITANGLYGTAFSQIKKSAKPGDILLLESGYNDRAYDSLAVMKTALTNMINEAEALGVKVILVSPNASDHDYKGGVGWTSHMADVARAEGVDFINLAQLSFDFLYGLYGSDTSVVKTDFNVSDRLHSTFKGAHKWASVVAGGMYKIDACKDLVDTEYIFSFIDSAGNAIYCNALGADGWIDNKQNIMYTQNFNGVANPTSVAVAQDTGALKLGTDNIRGKYLAYDFSGSNANSRGLNMEFSGLNVSGQDKYVVEFDAALTPGSNDPLNLTLKNNALKYFGNNVNYGAESGYILNLASVGSSTTYTVNGTKQINIPRGEWCHYLIYVDKTQGVVSTTITGATTGEIVNKLITPYSGNGNVTGIYECAGRYKAVINIDNIIVRGVTG